jgi:hypothetical protein
VQRDVVGEDPLGLAQDDVALRLLIRARLLRIVAGRARCRAVARQRWRQSRPRGVRDGQLVGGRGGRAGGAHRLFQFRLAPLDVDQLAAALGLVERDRARLEPLRDASDLGTQVREIVSARHAARRFRAQGRQIAVHMLQLRIARG